MSGVIWKSASKQDNFRSSAVRREEIPPKSYCQSKRTFWGIQNVWKGITVSQHISDAIKNTITEESGNLRSMNQGKLDIIKQEMARLNFSVLEINEILGISELKWMGLDKFNSDDHYNTVDKNPLEEMELPSWSKTVWNAALECNLKSDRIISVYFWGKPFNITVIQVYTQTTDVEEAEVDQFCEDLEHLIELKPKERCPFHYRGLECESRKPRGTSGNRKVCPWRTKWGRAKANRPFVKKICWSYKIPFSNNPRDDSAHGHHWMINTEIRFIMFCAAKDEEALYSQSKQDL